VLDPGALERLVHESIPFERIDRHVRAGLVEAVTISTTHVATGHSVVFVEQASPEPPAWDADPTFFACLTPLRAEHALASSAIPFLFPAVPIDGELYCEGGLRQNMPLVPALRLGADGLLVVSPQHVARGGPVGRPSDTERAFADPLFLFGKTLNALLLDRVDYDADRFAQINRILSAGCRRFGPRFVAAVNEEMGYPPGRQVVRPLRMVLVRASRDIGQMSVEYVRSPAFARRARGLVGRVIRHLAEADAAAEADLLSYLVFDGEIAERLIELGRADARTHHDELCALFEPEAARRPAAAEGAAGVTS
jgi:NTE family protein